ncbi:hypothetical protein DFH09DRAFT_1353757 [Mycena vulgaris]|nr:hypothetical protein DFH09DRAFT_1353757 [Mycena vulgaris]
MPLFGFFPSQTVASNAMESKLQPLRLPELTVHCVEFLSDSVSDLKACALISRHWVDAAQSRLFRHIPVLSSSTGVNPWDDLLETLQASPHLVKYIQRLDMNTNMFPDPELFSEICNVPFKHLVHVCIVGASGVTPPLGLAIQRLLNLPTLRRVKLVTLYTQPTRFLQLWDGCSRSIQHLDLYLDTGLVRRREFASALGTVEALDFVVDIREAADLTIDLSLFPRLKFVRLAASQAEDGTTIVATLSTITPSTRIHKVLIHSSPRNKTIFGLLDSILAAPALPHPILLELNNLLEVTAQDCAECFPLALNFLLS